MGPAPAEQGAIKNGKSTLPNNFSIAEVGLLLADPRDNRMEKKIGIVGIGNLLISDEGFGPHFVEHLVTNYDIPENISVLDGGTAGIMLAPFIEDNDILYVVDIVSESEGDPGSIHCYSNEDVRSGNIQSRMSPHQVGLFEIFDICALRGKLPEQIEMLTVVPVDLTTRIGLSPELQNRITDILSILQRSLADHKITLIRKKRNPAHMDCLQGDKTGGRQPVSVYGQVLMAL